jgi:carbamoyltransferase
MISQKEMDIAKSVQVVFEHFYVKLARAAAKITGKKNLCLAGGCALNCVGNGKIFRENIFDDMWIQPAAGDAGGALGCALHQWYSELGNPRHANGRDDFQKGSLLGPSPDNDTIQRFLDSNGIKYSYYNDSEMPKKVAELIASQKVVALMKGRMEFGPRALGARSIIADPANPEMQSQMNLKIKFRESFRPFAPSVLEERAADYFKFPRGKRSPYMLLVTEVRDEIKTRVTEDERSLWGIEKLKVKRSTIPAVTHVDCSARIQTVDAKTNPFYHSVISEFEKLTSRPVIINTSFNVRGEPIVCSHEDAYRCFMRTNIDYLVLENFLLDKTGQKPLENDSDWRKEFALD